MPPRRNRLGFFLILSAILLCGGKACTNMPDSQTNSKLPVQSTSSMKYLIVGLGNPGAEYEDTRHNIGFMVLDELAQKKDTPFETVRLGQKCLIKHKGRQIHLLKPNTFMNLSGKAVNYWLKELKIERSNLLVIVDDLALEAGKLRMRAKGSAGGHNGLGHIEQVLPGSNYPRLRFGIGSNFSKGKQVEYVLGKFEAEEIPAIEEGIQKAQDMVLSFSTIGISQTMTQFND